jgi:hypothetical protein
MNKKNLFLIISILAIFAAAAYFFLKPKPVKTVATEMYSLVDSQYLSTEDTTRGILRIDMSIEIPSTYQDEKILEKIRNVVYSKLFGDFLKEKGNSEVLKQYAKALKDEYIKNNSDFAGKLLKESKLVFNNSFYLEGFSLLNDENIFSYGITREIDLGGTYPSNTRYFYNFNLKTGEVITEKDIFNDGFELELTDIIKEQIIADSKASDDDEIPSIDNFENSEYIADAIKPNGNFYINDEAICYVFNPYEIAPVYYLGETEVVIPYNKIKHLMRENNPIAYLVNIPVNNTK